MSKLFSNRVVFDMNRPLPNGKFLIIENETFEYDGPVALCKGDDVAKQQEAQQAQFNQQLMKTFQTQFSQQSSILSFLTNKLQPMIDNPTGYSAASLAAQRASATDTLATQYDNAEKALQNKQFALGGRDLPSGVNEMQLGSLKAAQASDTAAAQNTITQNDENLKENNYWNALNVLSGNVASQYNPLGYAGAATNGSNAVTGLSQAVTASNQSQLLGALGGIAGGVGTALSGKLPCWVAAAIWGSWFAPETIAVRRYLVTDFSKHWYGRLIVRVYAQFGERVSKVPVLVKMLRPLFEIALRKARKG